MKKNNNQVKCSKLGVDCVKNDPVDIRCGGPNYLGFDFCVRSEEKEEMINYIKATLDTLKVPFVNITYEGLVLVDESQVFDKDKIFASISKDASYLINESNLQKRR